MSVFDIMAEAKIRQWELEKKERKASPPKKATLRIDPTASLEKQLYIDIRKLIIQSYLDNSHQEEHQNMAAKLEVQLSARLEKSGYMRLSKLFSDELRTFKAKAFSLRHDTQQLKTLFNSLET
ncbi:hypothetical protein [Desulfovibrio inopinatus]|uniref:hypothetical protein n=1 Tax=Desulfovibrio inopinatus TaxID=102109 RepID=UPI00040D8CA5|nr:hypothetical protein [Desulfovibrio inopinatus]